MKFYKKLVIDIGSGTILDAQPMEYYGPVAELKSTKSTTTVNIPPPTQAEKNQQKLSELTQAQQLHDLGFDITRDAEGNITGMSPRTLTAEEQSAKDQQKALEDWAFKRVTNAGPSAEETALVDQIYGPQLEFGKGQIDQFVRELAGSRGLNTTDSPILNAASLGIANLQQGLGGARASSLLDIGQRQQNFAESLREFQAGLNQQRFMNLNGPAQISSNLIAQMSGLRGMQTTTQQNTSGGGGGFNLGGMLGGIGGGIASGLIAM